MFDLYKCQKLCVLYKQYTGEKLLESQIQDYVTIRLANKFQNLLNLE